MKLHLKFKSKVDVIEVTVYENEMIVEIPQAVKAYAPLPQPKTLYEVFDEAGALDEKPEPPAPSGKGRKRKSNLYRFDEWYQHYPRKSNRGQAEKVWERLQADDHLIDTMIRAVQLQCGQPDWVKDNGAFIPHPGTWLNNKRWLDEVVGATPTKAHPFADRPWGAFIKEGQPHEVLNLMASVGLDDADAVIENLQADGLEATCDWLWAMRAAE
jgi:hypothetical protein